MAEQELSKRNTAFLIRKCAYQGLETAGIHPESIPELQQLHNFYDIAFDTPPLMTAFGKINNLGSNPRLTEESLANAYEIIFQDPESANLKFNHFLLQGYCSNQQQWQWEDVAMSILHTKDLVLKAASEGNHCYANSLINWSIGLLTSDHFTCWIVSKGGWENFTGQVEACERLRIRQSDVSLSRQGRIPFRKAMRGPIVAFLATSAIALVFFTIGTAFR